jgi:pectate lyase
MKKFFALFLLTFIFASFLFSQDGFGRFATGGAGGASVTVTNASEYILYATSPLPYVITISGTITLSGGNKYVTSNKTFQGADSNATLNGGLYINSGARNIIVKNLNLTNTPKNGEGDGITIMGGRNVFVTHCTFTDCADGSCDVTEQADSVTISWCRFRYVSQTTHRYVNLIGSNDATKADSSYLHVTFHHCWYDQLCNERMPSVRYGRVHVYNNYYSSDSALYGVRTRLYAQCVVENNYFEHGKNPWELGLSIAPGTTTGKLRAANNNISYLEMFNGIQWIDGWYNDGVIVAKLIPGTDTVFTPPYSYSLNNALDVKNMVIAGAGNKGIADGVSEPTVKITGFVLYQNYPNPFNPSTTVRYSLVKSGRISLKVYDVYGREIATLAEGMKSAGQHQEVLHGGALSSGIYFARLTTEKVSQTIKLLLAK